MKKFRLLLLVVLFLSITTVNAQETKKMTVSDFTILSGKTALGSGLDTRVSFSNGGNGILYIQANSDRLIVNIGKKIKNFQLIESIGIYKNVFWTGPMIIFKKGILDILIWNGISLATDQIMSNPGYKPTFFFSYEGAGLTFLNNNRIGGAVMWLKTDKMNWFASYKKTFSVGEKSKLFGEITYNHSLDIPMFVAGYTLRF